MVKYGQNTSWFNKAVDNFCTSINFNHQWFFLPYIGLLSSVALTAGSTSKPNDGIKNMHYHETKSSLIQPRIVLYQNTNVLHSRVGDPWGRKKKIKPKASAFNLKKTNNLETEISVPLNKLESITVLVHLCLTL